MSVCTNRVEFELIASSVSIEKKEVQRPSDFRNQKLGITKTIDSSQKQSQSKNTRTKIDRKTEEGTRFGYLWDPYPSLCVRLAIPTHESLINHS